MTATKSITPFHVFLCNDATGRYCWVRMPSSLSVDQAISDIETAGLEVCEDQSSDYQGGSIHHVIADTVALDELSKTDAIVFP
jgi:hypothetical protein